MLPTDPGQGEGPPHLVVEFAIGREGARYSLRAWVVGAGALDVGEDGADALVLRGALAGVDIGVGDRRLHYQNAAIGQAHAARVDAAADTLGPVAAGEGSSEADPNERAHAGILHRSPMKPISGLRRGSFAYSPAPDIAAVYD